MLSTMVTKDARVTGKYDAVYPALYPAMPIPEGYADHKPLPDLPFFVDINKLSDEEIEELRREYNR